MVLVERNGLAHWLFRHCLKPGLIAVGFVLVALLSTLPLQREIAYPFVFLFFGAIMGSAWFGGIVAGFLATLMSSLLVTYFFVPPLYSMSVADESRTFLTAFIVCAVATAFLSSNRKSSETAIRNARDQLEVRVRERTAELLRSNAEILEREHQLRAITEAIPQQIWRANARGFIDYCNGHLCDYIGSSMDALTGEAIFNAVAPEDEPLFRQGWNSAVASGDNFEAEVRVRGASGLYRWFLVRSIARRSEDGQVACWYGIHIDIEQQHQAQTKLIAAQDDLSRLSRTLSLAEMAASIAHELNQPLTAVVTHAYACRQWLFADPPNLQKAAATAEKIVKESTRAGEVVARVRALFRKDSPHREMVDLNRLVRELIGLLRDEAIRRRVSIKLHLAEEIPLIAMDRVLVQQVLLNLSANAMDAMSEAAPPRELVIRSEKHGEDGLLVAVEDSGSGIAPEIAGRIFEPFFSTKPHGIGMGLAICRGIVEAHDGRLWSTKANNGGAVFLFTLRAQL
jgi:PAS domain S-box-containing protein